MDTGPYYEVIFNFGCHHPPGFLSLPDSAPASNRRILWKAAEESAYTESRKGKAKSAGIRHSIS
jgi:hypothetical protein